MGVGDSLKDFYYKLEDKWYSAVDKVSGRLPFLGKAVDKMEEKNIPTFPLALGAIVIILILIFAFLFLSSGAALGVTVLDAEQKAVAGAMITVYITGTDNVVDTRGTDTLGKATFYLANGSYTLKVEKNGFITYTTPDGVSPGTEQQYILTAEQVTVSRAVALKTASGALIDGSGFVRYSCSTTPEIDKTTTYANGKFNAELDSSCTQITIDSVQGYTVASGSISFSAATEAQVTPVDTSTGTINVTLMADDGITIPPGLKVSIVPTDGTTSTTLLNETGTVSFTSAPTKSYYIMVTDPTATGGNTGRFAPYNGQGLEIKELTKNATIAFNVKLAKVASTTITVNVKDVSTGQPLAGVGVKMYTGTNVDNADIKTTGATGQVTFNAADGTTYSISAEHPAYMIGNVKSVTVSGNETVEFNLLKATADNSQSLLVKVTDQKGNIVDTASVALKKMDGTVVDEGVTGADGTIEFFNVELGSYFAFVSKEKFGGSPSQTIDIQPRRQNVLNVTITIGEGLEKLRVLDPENTPLRGVVVKEMNYYTQQVEEQKTTGTDGTVEFNIRADKLVYFAVESADYPKYFTAANYADEGSTTSRDIVLVASSGKLSSMIVVPVSAGSSTVGASATTDGTSTTAAIDTSTVSQGVYTVRALLIVPKGGFSEAGLHLRTGKATDGVSNIMEEDSVYISKVTSSATRTVKGTTYTPPSGYDTDSKNITTGSAKWVNAVWKNPAEGVYEVEADITITEVNPNEGINLWYRAWAKGSSMLRDPPSAGAQNELYSTAKNYVFNTGATNLCANGFCRSFTLKTASGSETGRTQYVNNTFSAKKDTSYVLTVELTNHTGRAINGAVLSIEGKGLDINGVSLNGAAQDSLNINLGNLDIDAYNRISIPFTTVTSGTESIKLAINSSTKTEYEETIIANVKANKTFSFVTVPYQIIPYIENSMFFYAADGNTPLSGVLVTISKGPSVLNTTQTGEDGYAHYILAAPRIGDTLTITAAKEGYDTLTYTKPIEDKVLLVTPPTISETIKIGEVTSVDSTILLQNATVKDITIKSIKFSSDLAAYLTTTFSSTVEGTVITSGTDQNFTLSIKPNSTARTLKSPRTIKGTMTIESEVNGVSQKFSSNIAVDIRLAMPGFLDSDKCFKVTPSSLDFITGSSDVSQTISVENSCVAEGINVTLHDITAKLSAAAKYGSFTISGTGFTNAQVTDAESPLLDSFDAEAKDTFTVKFAPNSSASSGTQAITLTLGATNIADEANKEKVESTVTLNATMSNLTNCLTVVAPSTGIVLDVSPLNTGYGALLGSNMSPYAQSYPGFSQQGMPYGMQSTLPFMSSNYTGAGTQNGLQQTGLLGQDSFIITNNCALSVDVSLEPDSRINVSQQKFTIDKDSDTTVTVSPGYMLGAYKIKVNAKVTDSEEAKQKIQTLSVLVRKLGDTDPNCIKVNVTTINLDSFVYRPQTYSVYNYCYDTGVYLARDNKAVKIDCTAPSSNYGTSGVSYFQTGMGNQYAANYPLGGANPTYNSYLGNGQGCTVDACSLITGTRVKNRSTSAGSSGTIEEVQFEVLPSAQYLPQRKLFDQRTNSYGLFSSLGDIRQWATETDARTNVYGNVNVQYTNQYGSTQCMSFPVQIEDTWRVGESIDSAINWGDPNASPQECINSNALDLMRYWKVRVPSGAIPDNVYTENGTKYIYIAEPPAVQIGPAPISGTTSALAYPQTSTDYWTQYAMIQQQQSAAAAASAAAAKSKNTKSKNCGLLDSISNLKQADITVSGVTVHLEETSSGSILKNKLGSNIMVQVDRTNIQGNCVYIEAPVTATLRRAISLESGEVGWTLRILVTRPGYTPKFTLGTDSTDFAVGTLAQIKNECATNVQTSCEQYLREYFTTHPFTGNKTDTAQLNTYFSTAIAAVTAPGAHPECLTYLTLSIAKTIYDSMNTATVQGACVNNSDEYGFKYIDTTNNLDDTKLNSNPTFCSQFFCNNNQTYAFLLKKYADIKGAVSSGSICGGNTSLMLSDLYKTASKSPVVKVCNGTATASDRKYYLDSTGEVITDPYTLGSDVMNATQKTSITGMTPSSITDMLAVLNAINTIKPADQPKLVLKVPASQEQSITKGMTDLNMVKVGSFYYMPLSNYIALNTSVNSNSNCLTASCLVNICGNPVTLNATTMNYMTSGVLVKAIVDGGTLDANEKEKVYMNNSALNNIHKLAVFNTALKAATKNIVLGDDLMMTKVSAFTAPDVSIFSTALNDVRNTTITFSPNNTEVGRYQAEMDYDLCNVTPSISVKFGTETDINKSAKNILLAQGYNFTSKKTLAGASSGNILEMSSDGKTAIFNERTPVKMTASLVGGEGLLSYTVIADSSKVEGASSTLITWRAGSLKLPDQGNGLTFAVPLVANQVASDISAIYYYPLGAELSFQKGTAGYTVRGSAVGGLGGTGATSVSMDPNSNPKTFALSSIVNTFSPNIFVNLDQIVAQVREHNNACVDDTRVFWNEDYLIKN